MSKESKNFGNFPKKYIFVMFVVIAIVLIGWLLISQNIFANIGGKSIEFRMLTKAEIPNSIERDIIPEYRQLERALGCLVDGKVYVVVTRGEKPTAGYTVSIDKMSIEKRNGKTNLKVNSIFGEPKEGETVANVSTYPVSVAETNLTVLPDTIELIIEYGK